MPRASFACEVKMLSAQTAPYDRDALMRRLRERTAAIGRGQDPATQTGHIQDGATQTGHIQDGATQTGHIQDGATQTGHIQDRATQTGHIQDSATQTGHIQDGTTQTGDGADIKPATILTDEIKEFIVRGLARYETPSRVAAAVKNVFGIEVNRQQVFSYHARGSRPPAERWCELFEATREIFLADLASIGVAQKAFRLHKLERFTQHAEENGYYTRAAKYMEQAAKECGGIYEGRKRAT
jgi:hypothetical protein